MVDRRLIENFDWGILIVTIMISFVGIMTIYSATRPVFDSAQLTYYTRQLYWLALSIFAFFVVISIDYNWFIRFANYIFFFGIIMLVIVLVAGHKGMGATRWIDLGFVSFQPSEFFKIFFIIALSKYLAGVEQWKSLDLMRLGKVTVGFFALPAILVLKQPDLGTTLILLFIFIAMVLTAGIRKKIIITIIIASLIVMPLAGNILWKGLKDYQKNRITAFIDPQADPHGIGYHIKQSKVSIGSGGFIGKGYMKGTQGPYSFLPEKHTDFIFSIFAEEWGFMGSLLLFSFYFFIIWRGLDTAKKARDMEGCFIAAGITFMFSFYVLINAGMTLGMLPVVGVPMPLMSYGGTALLSNFIAIGLIENVRMRRFALYY